MAQKVNETLDLQSAARIINLPAPGSAGEPARKTDLDAVSAGFNFIEKPVVAVATANVNIASPGATIDGVAPTSGDATLGRILLAGQTNDHENGIWIWNGAASALTRSGDTYQAGTLVAVGPDGGSNPSTVWLQSTDSPVVGTSALTFTQFGKVLSAGTGVTITGNVVSLTSPVVVALGGTGSTTAAGARTNLSAAGTYEQDFGDGASASFTITHNLGKQYVVVQVYNKSTGAREDCAVVCNSTTQCTLSAEAWTAAAPGNNAYHVVVHG